MVKDKRKDRALSVASLVKLVISVQEMKRRRPVKKLKKNLKPTKIFKNKFLKELGVASA
jgi:hypothetical protein